MSKLIKIYHDAGSSTSEIWNILPQYYSLRLANMLADALGQRGILTAGGDMRQALHTYVAVVYK